jgi:hypothetical protein
MKQEAAKIGKHREEAERELRKLLEDPETEDELILEKLKALRSFGGEYVALRREYEAKMVEGLTVRQRAKLELFKSRFEKDMRRLIHRVGRGRGGRDRGFRGRKFLRRDWGRGLPPEPPPPHLGDEPMPPPPLPEGELQE